jgi:hypothetical protein
MRALFILILISTNIFYSQGQIQTYKKLSLTDFENTIKPTMGYDTIISKYGYPNKTTGSGLAILMYTLIDSTTLTIGCHNKGTVYATHCDKNGNIRDLIFTLTPDQSQTKKKFKKPRQNKNN